MKERENRWFPQGVCESAGEVTELSEKKRRLGKHKLTFSSFLPVLHITPWHGLPPPHTHKNTNTPLQEHSNSGKVQQPPKFQQHMTQMGNSRDLAPQNLRAIIRLIDYQVFRNVWRVTNNDACHRTCLQSHSTWQAKLL